MKPKLRLALAIALISGTVLWGIPIVIFTLFSVIGPQVCPGNWNNNPSFGYGCRVGSTIVFTLPELVIFITAFVMSSIILYHGIVWLTRRENDK